MDANHDGTLELNEVTKDDSSLVRLTLMRMRNLDEPHDRSRYLHECQRSTLLYSG